MNERVASQEVMDALDMPEPLQNVQDAYWTAQREWKALDLAYRTVVADMLHRLGSLDNHNEPPKG